MAIDVTARHMKVRPEVHDHAWAEANKLVEEFPNIEHLHMILEVQKRNKRAEVVVQGKPHLRIEGHETTDNLIASIDAACSKVEVQLRKLRDKVVKHR